MQNINNRREYLLSLDAELVKFIRKLGANTGFFSPSLLQKTNELSRSDAVKVIRRGLSLGVMSRRDCADGYKVVSRDMSHAGKR
ncbi:hypothetical protein [Sansalvadorimonas verongulae]|uniref:hypothetical protein n=1 Tax=Sansalvadorimonas verongulae TaxID=2172824 RepID=UPI0012BC5CFB|nr:hypothetical protein [Sansalvadorimonas verongulae]MTI12399.1 hypothetical protein [Sansalvadorimonas verongulae]